MNCVCIIPARGGSKRIPNKNIKEFHGKPIIAYSIKAAQDSGIFDDIYVSTDSEHIAVIAEQLGANIHYRHPSMAIDSIGTQNVMQDTLIDLSLMDNGKEYDYACCLYPTAPMLNSDTLKIAYQTILSDIGYYNVGYVIPVAEWLSDPGQFYFGRAKSFVQGEPLLSIYSVLLPISSDTACDINTDEDWNRAEKMYAELMENKS